MRNFIVKYPGILFLATLISILFISGFLNVNNAHAQMDSSQKCFDTPESALKDLLTACKDNNSNLLIEIFGNKHKDIIETSDKAQEQIVRKEFYEKAIKKHGWEKNKDGSLILVVGDDKWPFPVPLVKDSKGWYFDGDSGREEIINRRVGENELKAIKVCLAYWEAQLEYAEKDRDNDEVLEYAQKFASSPGNKDGLYWEVKPESGEEISPLGPLVADAEEYIENRKDSALPFYGYYYKILTGQGSDVPGGSHDYIINGNMIAGFALVCYPADYGYSGVMTFIINHQGKVYEKDLGKNTRKIVKNMKVYNPDKTWKLVDTKNLNEEELIK